MSDSLRIDKWLWAARFYKTRSLAVEAINGGHVHVNGQRIKPSKTVQAGDELSITRGIYTWRIVIDGLESRRGPATEARGLYTEHLESIQQREALHREKKISSPALSKRPDKRQRRKIIRFVNKHNQ